MKALFGLLSLFHALQGVRSLVAPLQLPVQLSTPSKFSRTHDAGARTGQSQRTRVIRKASKSDISNKDDSEPSRLPALIIFDLDG